TIQDTTLYQQLPDRASVDKLRTPQAIACPELLLVKNTDMLIRFAGPYQDMGSMNFAARIAYGAGACRLLENVLEMQFPVLMQISLGPTGIDKDFSLPFIVAIKDGDEITSKVRDHITLPAQSDNTLLSLSRDVTVRITYPEQYDSRTHKILLAFSLSAEEYEQQTSTLWRDYFNHLQP
ncbi:MAG: hypothetical protein AAF352_07545, partial [Pseudomonadota bacterium]